MALWEVDGPEGSVTGVPNSMYLVTLSNSSQLRSLLVTDSDMYVVIFPITCTQIEEQILAHYNWL